MKILRASLCGAIVCSFLQITFGQAFFNLNFESARNLGSPPSTSENPANAFPGWTVTAASSVCYDTAALSGGTVSIIDKTNEFGFSTIQGEYFALLEGLNGPPFYGGMGPTSIAQTGQVPAGTESIVFWGLDQNLQISFNGNLLSFYPIGTGTNYTIYGANISAYAGQTGPLIFDAPAGQSDTGSFGSGEIDNIQFSTQAVTSPQLTIVSTANGSVVSWPSTFPFNYSNWVLQTNSDLVAGSWGNYAGTVVNNTVTNLPASGTVFFRLAYP